MAQITKPGTTILDFNSPPSRTTAISSSTGVSRELHPLPPTQFSEAQVADPSVLAKTLSDFHESVRRATLPMRQDPKSAPCYVRNVAFKNTSANAAPITVTIPHSLNRPHTILHVTRSQGAPYSGFEIANPAGQSPSTHATIVATVPGNTTAVHDFTLCGD